MGRDRGRRGQRRPVRGARRARAGARVLVLEKADAAWSGGNSAFTAGAIRFAHGGLEDLRDIVEEDERLAGTDLDPYTPRTSSPTCGASRSGAATGDGARAGRRLGRRRPLAAREGSALPADVRAPGVRGRRAARFWGGLAVGTVDGGEGLMAQHRGGGGARRDRAAPRRRGRGSCAARTARHRRASSRRRRARAARRRGRARRGRVRGQPADARRPSRPELGRGEGARHAAQHRRGAARGARPRRPGRTATGAAATRSSGTRAAPPTGDRELTNRYSRQSYPVGDRGQRRRRALHRRGRRLPQLHLRQVRRRGAPPAAGHRGADLRREHGRRCCARSTTRRRAPRAWTPTRSPSWPTALGIDPERLERTVARVQRRDPARRLRPDGQGRQAHRGHRAAEVQLGAAGRAAAVHRLPRHLRDHVHVRRRAGGRRRARARHRRAPAAAACSRRASWSAGCSSTTTPAAAG